MKAYFKISLPLLLALAGLCMLSSCLDETVQQPVEELIIQVKMPAGIKESVKYENQTVLLKSKRMTYQAMTDSEGRAVFQNIIPDIYSASTTVEVDGEKYIQWADSLEEDEYVILLSSIIFSGNFPKEQIFTNKTVEIALSKSVKQSLIISKIYASGTKDNNNKNYIADKYIEVYNNSDKIQYLDSIYLGLAEAESVIAFPASANPGYVYARQVFRFPGNGTDYPVLPGQSIVIANSAINHTTNSPTSVNLFNADFEAKNPTFSNNSNVKAITLVYSTFAGIPYMNLVHGGDNGVFLFRTHEDVSKFPVFYIPGKQTGNRYMRIPANIIFDGVETLKNKANTGVDVNTKRLQSFIDAGYMFINASGGYTNESIERRVDTSKSGSQRYYLIDSNNSLNDFRTVTDPTPRKYDKPLLMAN